jgi:5'-3' exonuclease
MPRMNDQDHKILLLVDGSSYPYRAYHALLTCARARRLRPAPSTAWSR